MPSPALPQANIRKNLNLECPIGMGGWVGENKAICDVIGTVTQLSRMLPLPKFLEQNPF